MEDLTSQYPANNGGSIGTVMGQLQGTYEPGKLWSAVKCLARLHCKHFGVAVPSQYVVSLFSLFALN